MLNSYQKLYFDLLELKCPSQAVVRGSVPRAAGAQNA
jgi:hypothetical protein